MEPKEFSIYISAGATLDIPVKATSEEVISDKAEILSLIRKTIYTRLYNGQQILA